MKTTLLILPALLLSLAACKKEVNTPVNKAASPFYTVNPYEKVKFSWPIRPFGYDTQNTRLNYLGPKEGC